MIYYGKGKIQYDLSDKSLAAGGEGEIYNINRQTGIVAKIYKLNKLNPEKERKLIRMIDFPPDKSVLTQIAWPCDVLYSNGKFVGFVMPKMAVNEDLNVIYEYGASAKYPDMPWENRIIIAENLCAVLDAIHNSGHVCGDLNPKNISVNPQNGFVVFLDTDSYHIQDGANTYRCDVGITEYLPAEVQRKMHGGSTLAIASLPTFSQNTDNFALAIHIFQLLMNGVHPFACAIIPSHSSVTAPQPSDNIEKGAFPFMQNIPGIKIPVYAPPITILPQNIQDMFKHAFIDGHGNPGARPKPAEWHTVLDDLRQNLKTCNKIAHHQYHNSLYSCPWCDADKVFSNSIQTKSASIQQISIKAPVSPSISPSPKPSPSISTSPSSSQFTMYVVSFDNNGGSGFTPSAKVIQAGSRLTLPYCTSVKSGFAFDYWNTNAAGTGANYRAGSDFTPTGNVAFYAKWKPDTGNKSQRTSAPSTPIKPWQILATILMSVAILGVVIVYSRTGGTNGDYRLSYDANGGEGIVPTERTIHPSYFITLPDVEFVRPGYIFGGWNTKSDGKGTNYNIGDMFTPTGNTILYAKWEQQSSTQLTIEASPDSPVPDGFVLVKGGTFTMGNPENNALINLIGDDGPRQQVTLSSFIIKKYEVTQKEYEAVMGYNPSYFKGANLPVEQVKWYEAIEFCNKLSENEGLEPVYTMSNIQTWVREVSGTNQWYITSADVTADWTKNGYRLPTEAEWEYAARGGEGTPGNFRYSGSDDVKAVAWYEGNSEETTHEVGTKWPNGLGIYDMSGNANEWCWDWAAKYPFFSKKHTNPTGPLSGEERIIRGGMYNEWEWFSKVTFRASNVPTGGYFVGIRLVRGII